jgi:hypothetical protein
LIGLQLFPITAALPRLYVNTLFQIPQSDSGSTNSCKIRQGNQIITPTKETPDVQSDADDDEMTIDYPADAGQNGIDSMDLMAEATRVERILQIRIPAKNDWRTNSRR